ARASVIRNVRGGPTRGGTRARTAAATAELELPAANLLEVGHAVVHGTAPLCGVLRHARWGRTTRGDPSLRDWRDECQARVDTHWSTYFTILVLCTVGHPTPPALSGSDSA